ncbi:MAG: TonB-dependent receptor [Pseudomonadota bacterium]|nr:TonB-dependent receptor [Pseudomonadota bacterium]
MGTHPNRNERRAVTLAALLLGTALGGVALAPPVWAQSAEQTQTYNIPSQPMAQALVQFSRTSGLQIFMDDRIAEGKTSGAVTGALTARSALALILAGSGLDYRFTNDSMVSISSDEAGLNAEGLARDALPLQVIDLSTGAGGYTAASTYEEAASIAYLDDVDIQRSRGVSVGDFLKGQPGVLNGDNRNSGALDVNVRGMQGQGRVPIVIDGSFQESTVYRGYSGVAGRTYLDPDLIGSMSIEKGPSAAADGAGATGGVVRVSTLRPDDIIPEGETRGVRLKLGLTSNTRTPPEDYTVGAGNGDPERFDRPGPLSFGDSKNGSIAIAQKFGDFEVLAAYARRQTGNYFAGENGDGPDNNGLNRFGLGEEVLNTSQDNTSVLLRGIYNWGDGQSIDLSYSSYGSDFGELMPSQIIRSGMGWQSPLSRVDVDTVTAQYRWSPADNPLIDLKADVYFTDNLTHIETGYGFNGIALPFSFASQATQWGVNLSNTSQLDVFGRPMELSYGISGKKELLRPPSNLEDYAPDSPFGRLDEEIRDGWRTQVSAFVAASYEATDKLTLDGSLRFISMEGQDNTPTTYYTDDGSGGLVRAEAKNHQEVKDVAPIISALYELRPGLQIYGKYAEAHRAPSLFEITRGWSAGPNVLSSLESEHAKNKEIGVNYQGQGVLSEEDLLQVKLSYFDNKIDNYITRSVPAGYSFVNIDNAHFKGFELSMAYENDRFFGSLSGTKYTDIRFCEPEGGDGPTVCRDGGTGGGYAQLHLPPTASASLTLGTKLMEDRLQLGTRVTYIGDRPSTQFSGDYTTTVDWDDYVTVDLFGSYQINDKFNFDFAIDNVADKYYMDALTLGLMPSPGRTVRVGLTANF